MLFSISKILLCVSLFFNQIFLLNFIFNFINVGSKKATVNVPIFGILAGLDDDNEKVFIGEKSLYKNVLITGSIGSGKTSSAMYPFTKQLIGFEAGNLKKKLGFLILDVKGNYYSKVCEFAKNVNRSKDVIVIELGGKYKYNPLDKPDLSSTVLANRLKTILLLFSPNNTESYWIDKSEQILACFIDYCRIYNNGYVSFEEIHKLVTDYDYFFSKLSLAKKKFVNGLLSKDKCYLLLHSIDFLNNDFFNLDARTYNLLKSEITRITNCFVSDYLVNETFCPPKSKENFFGFSEVISRGKIVVLNMNIAEYKNLSKIIAAYLKLDFQTDVLKQLANSSIPSRTTVFISDEYQEYVTSSDADFFSQSREAKCINIVSTQSYTSILNALNNQYSSKVIIQNLVNKFWFRTDDIFTIEDIQKQIGKEDKKKFSKTISESSKDSSYSLISKSFTSSGSALSESFNSYYQNDFKFDYNFFTQNLKTFECLSFISNDENAIIPKRLYMIPYFKNP